MVRLCSVDLGRMRRIVILCAAALAAPVDSRAQQPQGGGAEASVPRVRAEDGTPRGNEPVDWRTIRPLPAVRVVPPPRELAGENGIPTVPLNDEAIDIGQVAPLTYHALGVRLPDGRRPRIDGRMTDEVWQ